MSVKITPEDWQKFEKHYMMEFMRNPEYRFGQAFLNYFPELSKYLISAGERGESIERRLWNETSRQSVMSLIGSLILYGDIERTK
jgi:hypothetical protein